MPDGYVTGSSRMSYCNQTPFPPREGWGLGTRLPPHGVTLKSRNEEMRNGKWGNEEMGHCTSLQQTTDVSLLQSPKVIRKSMSIYCHSLRVHLCLMPKGIHSSQHHELCVLPAIYSTFDHLLEVCWICELFIATLFQLLQGVILRLLSVLHCYEYMYICLVHTALPQEGMYNSFIPMWDNSIYQHSRYMQTLHAVLCYCMLVPTNSSCFSHKV